jgi:hypothetical protein
VVTAGCYLLAGVGALRLVLGVGALVAMPDVVRVYTEADGSEAAGHAAGQHALILGIWSLFLGLVFLCLAAVTVRGFRWAWIVSLLLALLIACATGPQLLTGLVDLVTWYRTLNLVVSGLTAVLALAAIVLLVLPPALQYYWHRPQDQPAPPDRGAQQPGPVPDAPPAPPRKRRTGLVVGLVAGGLALLLGIGVGAVLALPVLTGDDKTGSGARAAAQHGMDLLRRADYFRYYDLLDSSSKASLSRAGWISIATCIDFPKLLSDNHLAIGNATLNGDWATVRTRSDSPGANTNLYFLLRFESHHWRFHEAGHYYIPNNSTCGT